MRLPVRTSAHRVIERHLIRVLRRAAIAGVAATLCVAAGGCSGSAATTATTAATTRTTDTFSGTVAVRGSDVHSFPVAAAGLIDVTLTATGTAGVVLGIDIGTPADGTCTAIAGASIQAAVGAASQLSGVVTPGTLCVDVHDLGTQTTGVTYTVTVIHP